jgi:hypothetical protein
VPKTLTRKQLQGRKEKAARFVRDVLGDSDRADEIADESLEHYADRRKIRMVNPRRPSAEIVERGGRMATKGQLQQRIAELEAENDDLQDQLDQVADIVAPVEGGDDDDADQDNGEDEQGND